MEWHYPGLIYYPLYQDREHATSHEIFRQMPAFSCDAASVLSDKIKGAPVHDNTPAFESLSGWPSSRPGYEPDTHWTQKKTANNSNLKPTLLLCSAYLLSCSELMNTKEWRLNVSVLLAALYSYVQAALPPTWLGPLYVATSILSLRDPQLATHLAHPKSERDPIWKSLYLLSQISTYVCNSWTQGDAQSS